MGDIVKQGRQKELQPCGCGCGQKAHWHKLRLLRGPDKSSFFVLDECREEFEKELGYYQQIREIRDALRGSWFFQRWPAARAWYCLQFLVRVRIMGAAPATRIARRDALMFVLPSWLARIYRKFKK
jgi:hypothetical protein